MTAQKDLKKLVRARMAKTGEPYTTARAHVLRAQDALPQSDAERDAITLDETVEAVVLKLNERSARIRVVGEKAQITFRAAEIASAAPGQIATLRLRRRWEYRHAAYASGSVLGVRTEIAKLALEPLPLEDLGLDDPGRWSEPYVDGDPYVDLWRRFTGRSRPSYELDVIAWEGAAAADLDIDDPDAAPISEAAELHAAGDVEEAHEIVMDVLGDDLRCIDAHAHLGNRSFARRPERAMVHYEIGIGIADLSLSRLPTDHLLLWSHLYNRPFLRCLHGHALCLWRLRRTDEAARAFERLLSLSPTDEQGARASYFAMREGRAWQAARESKEDRDGELPLN